MSFEQAIARFEQTTAQGLEKLIQSEQRVIAFIGRSTCPYCQRFAPKLAEAQIATEATVHFVDSSNISDSALQELRTKYGIKTVPGLLVANNTDVSVVCDSSLSVEEIKAFIA